MAILIVKDKDGNEIPIPAMRGKSAYEYAKEGGYSGTEQEFKEKLSAEWAKKSDIPTDYAKSKHTHSEYLTEVPSEYVTESELNAKGYLTQHQDLGAYAKKTEIPTKPEQVGAEASGTAQSKVTEHNTSNTSHNDIRLLVEGLTNRLNALANSDDTTLDQMAEVVAYIKNNKSLIDGITTSKINISDIIDNLTTSVSNKPLSAKQGVQLKALIDAIVVPTKTSQLQNDSGFLTQHQDLSAYAKKATTLKGYGITDGATKEEVSNLSKQINDYVGVTIPDYWKEFVDSKESVIKEILDECGVEAFPFMFGADIHGSVGASNDNGAGTSVTKNIGLVCRYTMDKYNVPFTLFAGDIMSQASHTSEDRIVAEYEALKSILSPIKPEELLKQKGNHDGAWGAPVDGVYYLKNIGSKKIYNHIFREQSLDRNRVFGKDGSYFYVDSPQNVRIIMLNAHTTGDDSVDENGNAIYNSMKTFVLGNEQLNWLAKVALNVPEDMRVIVSAHPPFSVIRDGAILSGILEAFNKRQVYNNSISVKTQNFGYTVEDTTYTLTSVNSDFTEAKGKVVLYAHGHIHKDTIDTATYSFPTASITTAGADVRDTDPPLRTPNTATETALDMVIVSKKAINFLRFGAGTDRVIALDDTVYYSIKNTLTNVKNSNSAGTIVAGNSYSATITVNAGCELDSVTVTMGGVDVTSSVYSNGVITIPEVTGNVVITASATKTQTDEPTTGYTNIIDTVGYMDNKRLSTSDGVGERDASGYTVTGMFEVPAGGIVRTKGVNFNSTTYSNAWIYLYNKNTEEFTAAYATNKVAGGFTFTLDDDGNLTIESVYTCKLRLCGYGKGSDLIVTINEEITEGSNTSYTNQILISTDANGNIVGELVNYRYNSSDTLKENAGTNATGFIPVSFGDTVYFKNISFGSNTGNDGIYLRTYDSSGTILVANSPSYIQQNGYQFGDCEFDEEGNIASIIFNSTNSKNIAKMRISYVPTDKQAIITVNEDITD